MVSDGPQDPPHIDPDSDEEERSPRRRRVPANPLATASPEETLAARRRNRRIGFSVALALILIPVLVIVVQAMLGGLR